jgi:hypothetical protein
MRKFWIAASMVSIVFLHEFETFVARLETRYAIGKLTRRVQPIHGITLASKHASDFRSPVCVKRHCQRQKGIRRVCGAEMSAKKWKSGRIRFIRSCIPPVVALRVCISGDGWISTAMPVGVRSLSTASTRTVRAWYTLMQGNKSDIAVLASTYNCFRVRVQYTAKSSWSIIRAKLLMQKAVCKFPFGM